MVGDKCRRRVGNCRWKNFKSKRKNHGHGRELYRGLYRSSYYKHCRSSAYYKGSIISYANDVKEHVLNVKHATLPAENGAVSEKVEKW